MSTVRPFQFTMRRSAERPWATLLPPSVRILHTAVLAEGFDSENGAQQLLRHGSIGAGDALALLESLELWDPAIRTMWPLPVGDEGLFENDPAHDRRTLARTYALREARDIGLWQRFDLGEWKAILAKHMKHAEG